MPFKDVGPELPAIIYAKGPEGEPRIAVFEPQEWESLEEAKQALRDAGCTITTVKR